MRSNYLQRQPLARPLGSAAFVTRGHRKIYRASTNSVCRGVAANYVQNLTAALRLLRGRLRVAARVSGLVQFATRSLDLPRREHRNIAKPYSTIHEQSDQKCIRLLSFSNAARKQTDSAQ